MTYWRDPVFQGRYDQNKFIAAENSPNIGDALVSEPTISRVVAEDEK